MYRSMKQSRTRWLDELEKNKKLQRTVAEFHSEREAHIVELNKKKEVAEKAVEDYYSKLLTQIEKMKAKTLRVFHTQNSIVQRETRQMVKRCDDLDASLEEFCKDLENNGSNDKGAVRKKLTEHENAIESLLSEHTHTEYLFTGSAELMEFLVKQEHLGMVSVLDKLSPLMEVSTNVEEASWDSSTMIHASCCHLSDKTLVLGDIQNSVHIGKGKVTQRHQLDGAIDSLCQAEDDSSIAVLLRGERKVNFYKIPSLKRINTIEFEEDICGISKYNDGFLIASPRTDPPRVYIADRNGSPYSCLGSEPVDGEELFRNPKFTASKVSGEIIVCDTRSDGIHVFHFKPDGELDWKRVLSGVRDMTGLAVGAEGNIFVCGSNPPCIFELNVYGFIGRSFPYNDNQKVIAFDFSDLELLCRSENEQFIRIVPRYPPM